MHRQMEPVESERVHGGGAEPAEPGPGVVEGGGPVGEPEPGQVELSVAGRSRPRTWAAPARCRRRSQTPARSATRRSSATAFSLARYCLAHVQHNRGGRESVRPRCCGAHRLLQHCPGAIRLAGVHDLLVDVRSAPRVVRWGRRERAQISGSVRAAAGRPVRLVSGAQGLPLGARL
jgi:hypothetical protein